MRSPGDPSALERRTHANTLTVLLINDYEEITMRNPEHSLQEFLEVRNASNAAFLLINATVFVEPAIKQKVHACSRGWRQPSWLKVGEWSGNRKVSVRTGWKHETERSRKTANIHYLNSMDKYRSRLFNSLQFFPPFFCGLVSLELPVGLQTVYVLLFLIQVQYSVSALTENNTDCATNVKTHCCTHTVLWTRPLLLNR